DESGPSHGDEWIPIDISVEGAPIPYGQHDTTLFKVACSLRQRDWDKQEALEHLVAVCENRCENYGTDYVDMCEKKIESAWKYEVKESTPVPFNGYSQGPGQAQKVDAAAKVSNAATTRSLDFVRGDAVKSERLVWIWKNRILRGKLNSFSGEPGVGKGM